jgi:hypothetical protein
VVLVSQHARLKKTPVPAPLPSWIHTVAFRRNCCAALSTMIFIRLQNLCAMTKSFAAIAWSRSQSSWSWHPHPNLLYMSCCALSTIFFIRLQNKCAKSKSFAAIAWSRSQSSWSWHPHPNLIYINIYMYIYRKEIPILSVSLILVRSKLYRYNHYK